MLEAHQLAGQRGTLTLFAGVAFRIDAGQALIVAGRNGTGKTTLLRMLAGLTAPAAGEIRWRGAPVQPFAPALRQAVLFAGHAAALKDALTAEENLASSVRLAGGDSSPKRIRDALRHLDLDAQRRLPARSLSAGQRRRLALARLLVEQRPLWVLDEPFTALDAGGIALLDELVGRQLDAGGIVIVASHQPLRGDEPRVRRLTLGEGL